MGRRKRTQAPRRSGGLLIGMRGRVKSAVRGAPVGKRRRFWDVTAVLLALAAVALVLHRCGVVDP